jgi:hypothetical protein
MFGLPLRFVIAANGKVKGQRLVQRAKRTGICVFPSPPIAAGALLDFVVAFDFQVHGYAQTLARVLMIAGSNARHDPASYPGGTGSSELATHAGISPVRPATNSFMKVLSKRSWWLCHPPCGSGLRSVASDVP